MINKVETGPNSKSVIGNDLSERINFEIAKSQETNSGFFVILLQMQNMPIFRKRRPPHVVNSLLREIQQAVRVAVHPSQHVSIFQDGLALVFNKIDVGQIDTISARLVSLTQHVIRAGKYNDLSSRWTDIIYEFLSPNKPSVLFTKVGWAIFPRDGKSPAELVKRAFHHAIELSR